MEKMYNVSAVFRVCCPSRNLANKELDIIYRYILISSLKVLRSLESSRGSGEDKKHRNPITLTEPSSIYLLAPQQYGTWY